MVPVSRRSKAFTLVEILIVVVILGILAAIVLPQFTNASDTARASNTAKMLQTVRSQLEWYRAEHNGEFPTLLQMWGNLTNRTDTDGAIDAAGEHGPYLLFAPVNPYTLSDTVVEPGTGTAANGWEYDEDTGAFYAVGFDEDTHTYTAP